VIVNSSSTQILVAFPELSLQREQASHGANAIGSAGLAKQGIRINAVNPPGSIATD